MGLAASNLIKEAPATFLRYTKRKARRFNAIARAEKVVDSIPETVRPPPKFESTLKQIDRIRKEMPDSFEKLHMKNDQLLKNLEKVYVRSEGKNTDMSSKSRVDTNFVKRFYEPSQLRVATKIPKGKYTSLRADQFLCAHAKNPNIFSPEVLSLIYDVDERAMRNILTHVKVLTIITPETVKQKPGLQRFAESMMPSDMLLEEYEDTKRKMHAASELFDKHYGITGKESPEMQEDKGIMTKLSLLRRTEKHVSTLKRNAEKVRSVKDDQNFLADIVHHASFTAPKIDAVKQEDVSFDELIEDAIRRSEENELKLQEEKKSKEEETKSKENTLAQTVSSQSRVTEPSEEESNSQVEDPISDEEIERLSKNIQSGNVVKRDGVSNTGYYNVENKRSKKEESN